MNGKMRPSNRELQEAMDILVRVEKQLQIALRCWDDDKFMEALYKRTPEEKQKAFQLRLEIEAELLMIENSQIESVVSQVKNNSQKLKSAITDLGDALQTISNVTKILNAVGSLLSLIRMIEPETREMFQGEGRKILMEVPKMDGHEEKPKETEVAGFRKEDISGAEMAMSTGEETHVKSAEMPDTDREVSLKRLPKKRVVNTGFAPQTHPDEEMDREMPLKIGGRYYFWVEIGEPREKSIEETPTDIPDVPAKVRLTVAIFGFKDGLLVTRNADIGELEKEEDGTVRVVKQPLAGSPPASGFLAQRLFFPVRCPRREGIFQMRCNIYRGQVLLQSRVIHARVMAAPRKLLEGQRALRSVLDYSLSGRLNPALLTQLAEHRLSILLNRNDDGTNSLHVYGSKGEQRFKRDDIRFEETKLNKFIEMARGSLRIASWNSKEGKEEWREGIPFKYQDRNRDLSRLSKDLINMAQWGREFYIPFKIRTKFEEVLYEPSLIQIAMKDSPTYVLPAAMIYDYPLSVGASGLSICPSFADAFDRGASLENHECFMGSCPTRKEKKIVCPSGFWGFRHYLGMPLSVEKKSDDENAKDAIGNDVSAYIFFRHDLKMVAGVATDLHLLQSHEKALEKLKPKLICQYADTRDKVFSLLQSSPHLVYFYCHGALLRDELSYLQVGANDKVFPSNFDEIKWDNPRPLVFMNGCHTIDPMGALNFIEPLVQLSRCAGVIGTEITIYEEMATVFAEEFFRRFLGGEAVGMAVRNARLKLLEEGNPLGLVYIPYAIAGLSLKEQTN